MRAFFVLTKTSDNNKTAVVSSQPQVTYAQLVAQHAQNLQLKTRNEATDFNVSNYHYNGPALKQTKTLAKTGNVDIYIDDDTLVTKDKRIPLKNTNTIVSSARGLIGRVKRTEHGIRVKYYLDSSSKLGGKLTLVSDVDSSYNGEYVIYKLTFNVSNRSRPFFYIAEALPFSQN